MSRREPAQPGPILGEPAWAEVPFRVEEGAQVRRAAAPRGAALKSALVAALRTLGAVVASAALSVGALQAHRWAIRSPSFSIAEVRFTGTVHAPKEELLQRSGLLPGQNLFRADLAAAARGLESHPWVISARVSRRFPPAVLIEVNEHKPAALVQLGGLYLLDVDGLVFKRASPQDVEGLDLPLFTGLSREEWNDHRHAAGLRLLTALQLLDAWRAAGLPAGALSEVRLDGDGGLTVFARDEARPPGAEHEPAADDRVQEVRVGSTGFAAKLQRLAQVRAALQRRGERAARIDLDNQARPEWVAAQIDHGVQPRRQ